MHITSLSNRIKEKLVFKGMGGGGGGGREALCSKGLGRTLECLCHAVKLHARSMHYTFDLSFCEQVLLS